MQFKLLTTWFLPFDCLCLIKICAYFHVTIIPTAVIDYQIEITLISILILKAIDSALLTKEKQRRMNGKMMTLTFFKLYAAYIKN